MITYCLSFFPAAGVRLPDTGYPLSRGVGGYYWAGSAGNATIGWCLDFYYSTAKFSGYIRIEGLSIRCVANGLVITTAFTVFLYLYNIESISI